MTYTLLLLVIIKKTWRPCEDFSLASILMVIANEPKIWCENGT
jgi:hypothetical protein